ncbi:hypothetical protein [Dyella japonica]|uniref:Uncharacterized protein n=1 Tax=Dyella japonica A8 TaxID=1217721 RepID=A0A075JVH1_9GAMM|nr:hypothetical protein [Dyella japonica]AIF46081.1 hypothetical protein HY57_01775 [Dyella japonica A8]
MARRVARLDEIHKGAQRCRQVLPARVVQEGTAEALSPRFQNRLERAAVQMRAQHRSPNILLIPCTSSVAHLRENMKAAAFALPQNVLARLDALVGQAVSA